MEEYLAVAEGGQAEIIEKKSRFIGYITSVETEEEAAVFIEAIRKEHYNARHCCYAYSIGTASQPVLRFSDDGEPQGTAGKPILEVIQGSGVRNICIVVIRYFGGTLLGTGGLVRAYTDAAKAGLDASVIRRRRRMVEAELLMDYTDFGKIQRLIENMDAEIIDTVYTERVLVEVQVYAPDYDNFVKAVAEATAARVCVERKADVFSL